jgi:hypothetical protein
MLAFKQLSTSCKACWTIFTCHLVFSFHTFVVIYFSTIWTLFFKILWILSKKIIQIYFQIPITFVLGFYVTLVVHRYLLPYQCCWLPLIVDKMLLDKFISWQNGLAWQQIIRRSWVQVLTLFNHFKYHILGHKMTTLTRHFVSHTDVRLVFKDWLKTDTLSSVGDPVITCNL